MSTPAPLRPGLRPLPARMSHLPVDARGYPVPFFVEWIEGKPDFRVADQAKFIRCVKQNRCWICGEHLGSFKAFCIGPMCALTRIISEPPQHRECSTFSAIACPFLTLPGAKRRDANLPAEIIEPAGIMIKRNPGAVAVWTTRSFRIVPDRNNRPLFNLGDPESVEWYAHGRAATREEILRSIDTGLPILREQAALQGADSQRHLEEAIATGMRLLPAA